MDERATDKIRNDGDDVSPPSSASVESGGGRLFPEIAEPPPSSAPDAGTGPRVFAVAGGKGGIGKSLVTASLGARFAAAGRRVTIVDADLGCPNLHTCLGLRGTRGGLSAFLKNRVDSLARAAMETGVERLDLVSGARDTLSVPNITYFEKQRLVAGLRKIPSESVLLDLSAGTAFNTLDLFLAADVGIVVTLPEPTSVENLYRFLRAVSHRLMSAVSKDKEVVDILNQAENMYTSHGVVLPAEIVERVRRVAPSAAQDMEAALRRLDMRLILNQTRRSEDAALGENMAHMVRLHMGLRMEFLGAVDYDGAVWESLMEGKILMLDYPDSVAASALARIADRLLQAF